MWHFLLGVIVVLIGMDGTKGVPIFALVGPNSIRLKENEVFAITASYQYCGVDSYLCPGCPRRVFINVFNQSKCLDYVQTNQMDCMNHNCKRRQFVTPSRAGIYEFKMYEILGNGSCSVYRDTSGQGSVVGTVVVGTPPQNPDVLVTNIGFYVATIQWTNSAKDVVYTVLIQDNKGNARWLAEKITKRRVMATKLTPGTDYNVSVRASNDAGDSEWIQYSFITRQASLSLQLAPQNKTVVEDEPFTLRCFISGRPRPRITWYKDGKRIGGLRKNNRILHVPRASANDEGEYVCAASNGMPGAGGNVTARANIVVLVPPLIGHLYSLLSHETISGRLGQTIVLLCGLNKDNHVNYAWFKDGSLLSNTSNHTNELTISLDRTADFGVYECEVFNKAGKARKRIRVFEDEEQKSTSSALPRSGGEAYYFYIVGILACLSLLLLVAIIALRQYYRRKLLVKCTEERPYLTPRDDLSHPSPQTARQTGEATEAAGVSRSIVLTDYSRPLPPIPSQPRSKVDSDATRYAALEVIEKPVYQELEREELGIKDISPDMVNAFENAVKLETEDETYVEVVP